MNSVWIGFTIVRFCLALMVGIGLQILCDYTLHSSNEAMLIAGALLLVATIVVVAYSYAGVRTQLRFVSTQGLALFCMMVALGYAITWLHAAKNSDKHFARALTHKSVLVINIAEPPILKRKTVTAIGRVEKIYDPHKAHKTDGKILLNFLLTEKSKNLKYGDVLVFKSNIEEFEEPKNPGEFSYKLYQTFHHIYHRSFLKTDDWKLLSPKSGNAFFAYIYNLREQFLHVIEKHVTNENDFGVATAIMLGYRDYINPDIIRAYSSSGALHVLSVSGLHLATMFFMLNAMLRWMDSRGRSFQIAKALLVLAFIWFYTCLTGLSPSVLRAAMMFSLLQAGKLMARRVHMFNVLAGSAMVLMVLDPYIITEVGFKLSYLAVLGIVYLHPKISSFIIIESDKAPAYKKADWHLKPFYFLRYDVWWFLRYAVPDFFWQLTAVSIAAQIATAPLGLYYFHQFPTYFLISNWVVIPVGNLILFSGTLLFAVDFIQPIGCAVGEAFNFFLHWLDVFIFWVDTLPMSLIAGISILMLEMILLYVLIVLLSLATENFARHYKGKLKLASLAILFLLFSYNAYETIVQSQQNEMVVYHIPKHSAVAFLDGRTATAFFDEAVQRNSSTMLFHIKHHLWDRGVLQETRVTANKYTQLPFGKLTKQNGKNFLLIDSAVAKQTEPLKNRLNAEVVVLIHNAKTSVKNLQHHFNFKQLVFDASNKDWRLKKWRAECDSLNIKYWDVNERGAFIYKME
jgi:competence protein ComEC